MITSIGCNKRIDTQLLYYKSFYDMISTLNEKAIPQSCIKVLLNGVYICCIKAVSLSHGLMNELF